MSNDEHEAKDEITPAPNAIPVTRGLDHIRRHLIFRHSDKGKHSCQQCPKSFCAKQEMQTHFVIQHMGKRFICNQCQRNLSQV